MAKRRKGQPINGWLLIDKPAGVTSTQVVGKARWSLNAQKAGHAGTLDPLATGLLAVAFGEATKTVPHAQEGLKTYRFTVRWGAETATDDLEGAVTDRSLDRPSQAAIVAALPAFTGDIEQIPPQFSAVKVDGARAYDLARDGIGLDLAARPLWVERLGLVSSPDPDHAVFDLVCGKGGYVRAIARDLGRALGCLGHVADLRRVASGGFDVADAMAFESLDRIAGGTAPAPLLPVQAGLADLREVKVAPEAAAKLRNGNAAPMAYTEMAYGEEGWASANGTPVALVTYRAGALYPTRVFNLDPPG